MSINSVIEMQNNTNRVHYQNGQKNLGSGKLDREGFMRLIMAQLQYQDPTAPQDNTQMLMQQLALEQADQMKNLVDSNKFSQAASMVGKEAELVDARWNFSTNASDPPQWDVQANSAKTLIGTIESVQFDRARGKALLKIDGNYYDADNIRQLAAPPPAPANGGP